MPAPLESPEPALFTHECESNDHIPEPRSLDRDGWIMLAVGPVIALVSFLFFWVKWTFSVLEILVHEMGHAIFGWVFGYPSLPAFDLIWGGGVTVHVDRSTALLLLVYALLAGLIVMYRRNAAAVAMIFAVIAVHLFCTFTKYHSLLIVAMGHGTELLIGGLFIYRALSGRAIIHYVERPLYSVIGFFMVFSNMALSYRLLTSWSERGAYAAAKGGHMEMDFIRIARDHLNWKLTSVALLFLVLSVLTPFLAYLAVRYEQYIYSALIRLLRREPA
ncbi:MAG: hypothetical protein HY912_22555 [Desulfomonile tiedjei]|uniref:Uncharacterized protein n=1 Tax=Desulfomonile tiedjei TaxID=2358 RepID=A0A9D6Z8N5_9BACT|nr:hypothetical protein [Desulfomonile tiedjei]